MSNHARLAMQHAEELEDKITNLETMLDEERAKSSYLNGRLEEQALRIIRLESQCERLAGDKAALETAMRSSAAVLVEAVHRI